MIWLAFLWNGYLRIKLFFQHFFGISKESSLNEIPDPRLFVDQSVAYRLLFLLLWEVGELCPFLDVVITSTGHIPRVLLLRFHLC